MAGTIIAILALLVSTVSLCFTILNWRRSNRPIVTAFVTEHSSGSEATAFNLVVANTGNRPARSVRLQIAASELNKLFAESATPAQRNQIAAVFQSDKEIPILRNGEDLTTAFGAFTPYDPDGARMHPGQSAEITVHYKDLDGREFSHAQEIKLYARHGFGGSSWSEPVRRPI